ncbi:MAG: hypothetical protein M1816_007880 [Peltula sp. TS41687]|nr:MAG: hypothetical protein M1816_007880 [Peltula sp. TS41687]
MLTALRRVPAAIGAGNALRASTLAINASRFRPSWYGINSIRLQSLTVSRSIHITSLRSAAAGAAARAQGDVSEGENHDSPSGSITKFHELADQGLVRDEIVKAITQGMGISTMTPVQSMTIAATLKGVDVLAQAKTGTGKTLAFLVPVLQNILKNDPELMDRRNRTRPTASDIRALVISPTRELAEQIAAEAQKVVSRTGIVVQTAVGGTLKRAALMDMQRRGCHLLVGTPGRLKDIFSDPLTRVSAPRLSTFVLDEADRLLDQGFWPEIEAIKDLLPNADEVDRQTLMFSATVPREVVSLVSQTMKRDYQFLRTVQEGEQPTHEKVPQKIVQLAGLENMMPALLELSKREMEKSAKNPEAPPFKAIVYFNSTANVGMAAETFRNLRESGASMYDRNPLYPAKILDIHSRLSQQQRTRASEMFRNAKSGLLFSSDVTARGMDFPNVTHVIQMGTPQGRDSYIHRIGRTGRANKGGEGWLFLAPMEMQEARSRLGGLPLQMDRSLQAASVDMSQTAELPAPVVEILTQVGQAAKNVPRQEKVKAYMGSLGTYGYISPHVLVPALNALSRYGWGLDTPPSVAMSLARRLGIDRVEGVNIGNESMDDRGSFGDGRSGFGGGGGFGGGARSFGPRQDGRGPTPSFMSRDGFGGERSDRGDRGGRYGGEGRYGSGGGFGERGGKDQGDRRGGGYGGSGGFRGRDQGGRRGDRSGGFGGRGRSDRGGGYGERRNRDGPSW